MLNVKVMFCLKRELIENALSRQAKAVKTITLKDYNM